MKSYFWGIFLIGAGGVLILKHYLNLNISTGRTIIGLFLLSLGLSVLINGFGVSDSNNVIFDKGRLDSVASAKDYSIVFGEGTLDLTNISAEDLNKKIEVSTVFGSTNLILPKDKSIYIEANSAFASTIFPDGSQITFGERTYQYNSAKKSDAELIIELNTVFGRTLVTQR